MNVCRIGVLALLAAASAAAGAVERPRIEDSDLFRARKLELYTVTNELGQARRGRPWSFQSRADGNVTYLSPAVRDAVFSADGLAFTAGPGDVLIGWGNYDNLQPSAERVNMFAGWNDVELTVSQTATNSVWRFQLWMDGNTTFDHNASRHEFGGIPWATVSKGVFEAAVTGTNRQTIRFRAFRGQPDGFSLKLAGPAGNRVTLHGLRITQEGRSGAFRRALALPAGRAIWRAVGEVSGGRLVVNGREVEFMPDVLKNREALYPVDLAPHLKAGAVNVLALDPAGGSRAYLQARVVLDDGSELRLDTGPEWKGAAAAADGWVQPGFDDAAWGAATDRRFDPVHLARRWPVYDGRLLLEHPGPDVKLYFDDTAPVRVAARIPGGWAGPRPDLRWTLRRVEADNQRPELARGGVAGSAAQPRQDSLIYEIDAGTRAQGVYTLEVELTAGGAVVEHRFEEPLIVVGRLAMPEVAGDTYEEGLDLELEDVIDFTDPADPHSWTEAAAPEGLKKGAPGRRVTAPRVVHTNGLAYREVTDGGAAALFAYRFEFQNPGGWYLLELEYPNDAERWIGAAVVTAHRGAFDQNMAPGRGSGYSRSAPALVTGGKFPVDRAMHTMRWLCWAGPEPQSIEILNLRSDVRPAAAACLRLYRVKALPALKGAAGGERLLGLHTERANHIAGSFFGLDGMDEYQNIYKSMGYDLLARFTQQLRWQAEGARNYTAYLRFCGLNADVLSAFQYNEENTAYVPPDRVPGDGRLPQDIREVALRYFERNGIAMFSLVEYMEHKGLRRIRASADEVAKGADTLTYVSRTGKQGGWCVNANHPAAETGYLRIADDLAVKFAGSPAWKGIFYNIDGSGTFAPGPYAPPAAPFDYDYADATIARFEQDTGIRTPGEPGDPERFALRHLFLTSDAMRERWIVWRGRAMGSYLTKTRDVLRRHRPDLTVLCGWHLTPPVIRAWLLDSPGAYEHYARQLGMNPAAVRAEPGIWLGRTLYPIGSAHGGRGSDVWAQAVDPSALAYYDGPNRLVVLNTGWYEYRTRFDDPGWPFALKPGTLGLTAEAHDAFVLEPFTQAMIGGDPDILLYGFLDSPILVGREQQRREAARAITPLPRAPFQNVLGTSDFRHNLAVRALRQNGDTWFYAANPGYWPIRGEVVLNAKVAVQRAFDGRPAETRAVGGHTVVPISLGPYGLASFRIPAANAGAGASPLEIVAWTNAPLPESELAHMRGIVAAVRGLLADPASALALPRADRDYLRAVCGLAETLIAAGGYAAAWSELTHWRIWELWQQVLVPAKTRSARLANRPAPDDAEQPAERPALRVARATDAPPVIDGNLDDAVWTRARPTFRFLGIGMGSSRRLGFPLMDMAVQTAYDDQALYVALRMADPDVKALKQTATPDAPIGVLRQYDDTVVIFLNAADRQVRQFAVNAGGVQYAAASGAWGVGADDLRQVAWQAKVSARPGEWVAEAAIPFAALQVARPASGDVWRANFLRRFRDFGNVPETWWAQVSRWENTEQYGALTFQ